MQQNELFNDEKIITQSDGNLITLTNYRIRYTDKEWRRAFIVSILLKNVSSIQIKFKSNLILLGLAIIVLSATIGIALGGASGDVLIYGFVAGLILIAIYFSTRKHYLTISSKGGDKINFYTKGMGQDKVIDFVNRVEKAMLNTI